MTCPARVAGLLAVFIWLVGGAPVTGDAQAQTTGTGDAGPVAGFEDGFFIQSPDGDHRLVFGILAQVDGRFSLDDPSPIVDTFTVRKARPILTGRVARYFDFKLMPDFGNGSAVIADAYVDVRFSSRFRVRTGKDKTPIGYEWLQGDAFLLFPERSLASNLVPLRDVGVQIQGDLTPQVSYAAGVFNGVPDGTSSSSDLDANNGKDIAGRILVQPFRRPGTPASALSGFGFHLGGSTGTQTGALPVFRTSAGQTYFAYATGAAADGTRTRVTPAAFYYYRALGVFGEYMRSTQAITRAGTTNDVTNSGWEVSGSYLLTGEPAAVGYIRPRRPFAPPTGTWGALQLVARVTALDVDDDIFPALLAAPGGASRATSFTVGANWFPATYVKYYVTFERTSFDEGTAPARPVEHVIIFRAQLGI